MVSARVLYNEMKKWVSDEEAKPLIQAVYFDGENVRATDSAAAVTVKNYKSESHLKPHFENTDGQVVDLEGDFPDFGRLTPELEDCPWRYEIKDAQNYIGARMKIWKKTFTYLRDLAKVLKIPNQPVMLQKKGSRLYVYGSSKETSAKILLLENNNLTGDDWEMFVNSVRLLNVIDFIIATEANEFRMYSGIENGKVKILAIETEDLIMRIACLVIKSNQNERDDRLLKFIRKENPEPDVENSVDSVDKSETED